MTSSNPDDKVAVAYDAADLRALYGACRRCRRGLYWILAIPVVFGVFSFADGERGANLAYALIPYIGISMIAMLAVYFYVPVQQINTREKNGFGVPMMIQLTSEGISTRHPNQDSLFHWAKILDVSVRGTRLFLFTTPACAIILPRRCFSSDEQFSQWAERSARFWREARAPTK